MRNLLFKNLTSVSRGRKIVASSEIMDKEGVHSVIHRHFACTIKQVDSSSITKPAPYLYILKEKKLKEKKEHFFCKVKGSFLALNQGKLLLIQFIHTLNVELTASANLSEQIN